MRVLLRAVLPILLILAVLPQVGASQTNQPLGVPAGSERATVTGHIDGDKFKISLNRQGETVLTAGIDAPERRECYFNESSKRVKDLLPKDTRVWLERSGTDRDDSERLLRYVWLEGKDGKKAALLNTKLVREGYAGFDDQHDNPKYYERLEELQQEAQDKEVGVWEACGELHAPAPDPTPTRAPAVTETYASGGLGLSRAEWEAKHGPGVEDALTTYEDGTFLVIFWDDTVWNLTWNLPQPVSLEDARLLALTLAPQDRTYVETITDVVGNPVDIYHSESLAGRYTVSSGGGPWLDAPLGTFLAIYFLDPDGRVSSVLFATGKNP